MADVKRQVLLAAGMLVALGFSACREAGEKGEYFAVSGKLFVFNYRVAEATYLVTLQPLQPMREGQTAVASFEDPAGGEAIVVRQRIWPKLSKVTLESPALRCVRKDRPYRVAIRIEDSTGEALQTIETTMTSTEDQQLLPDKPLVVGPVYTPNPELAGNPSGKIAGQQASACPSST